MCGEAVCGGGARGVWCGGDVTAVGGGGGGGAVDEDGGAVGSC